MPRTPIKLAESVSAALAVAGSGPFAVRSSATDEDLPDASYAGLYETFLGVERDQVLEAVRNCPAAAELERVSRYRAARAGARDMDRLKFPMAVLVQQMVDAHAAGVVFTADPLTGRRDQVLITAIAGLGESLVSGEAVGEQWVVTDDQPELTRADPDGPVLTVTQVRNLAELGIRVARRFDGPQDLEWAIESAGKVWLRQARPMTALPDPVR